MTRQDKKILLLTGAGLLLTLLARAGSRKTNRFSNFAPATAQLLAVADSTLQNLKLNDKQRLFALAQLLHETGNKFNTGIARADNNFTGIKWINKPYQNATRGSLAPASERVKPLSAPINYYAHFANTAAWAKDYARILNSGSKPLQANNIADFAARLKRNKYYTDSVSNYAKGLNFWYNRLIS